MEWKEQTFLWSYVQPLIRSHFMKSLDLRQMRHKDWKFIIGFSNAKFWCLEIESGGDFVRENYHGFDICSREPETWWVRVNEITEKTHLSRPAVSHHLQILKGARILKMRREATKNYYYFDPDMKSFELLIGVLKRAVSITSDLPDRSKNDEDWNDINISGPLYDADTKKLSVTGA